MICCWCNARVWGGLLVPGWGYRLQPCGHVSYPRETGTDVRVKQASRGAET